MAKEAVARCTHNSIISILSNKSFDRSMNN
jgi:hypothetical protein